MKTVAPAKINWTLEVLGRREDGYHEIRSVMQTIDLCDELIVEEGEGAEKEEGWVRSGSGALKVEGEHEGTEDDLTLKTVRALEDATGRELPIALRLRKRIPVAAGLGGGSSDAAAVLRLLNKLYSLGMSAEELAEVGARLGSDVPFFVYGGTALVEGRGERVTPLPDIFDIRVLIVAPSIKCHPDKTQRMYAAITPDLYTDGWKSLAMAKRIEGQEHLAASDLWNVFDLLVERDASAWNGPQSLNKTIAKHRRAIDEAGVEAVHLCGSGPSLFGIPELTRGDDIAARLQQLVDGQVYTSWTRDSSTATDVE